MPRIVLQPGQIEKLKTNLSGSPFGIFNEIMGLLALQTRKILKTTRVVNNTYMYITLHSKHNPREIKQMNRNSKYYENKIIREGADIL